jgi:hypothetical protein
MPTLTQAPPTVERTFSPPVRLQTTLYDLIAAINAETGPEEEELALTTIVHLLQTYRLTYTHGGVTYRLVCDDAECLDRVQAGMDIVPAMDVSRSLAGCTEENQYD